jgi:hypothetical protein
MACTARNRSCRGIGVAGCEKPQKPCHSAFPQVAFPQVAEGGGERDREREWAQNPVRDEICHSCLPAWPLEEAVRGRGVYRQRDDARSKCRSAFSLCSYNFNPQPVRKWCAGSLALSLSHLISGAGRERRLVVIPCSTIRDGSPTHPRNHLDARDLSNGRTCEGQR